MNTIVPSLLTVPEAAARLRLSKSKLYQIIQAGRLPIIKIDGSTRITPRALEEFIRCAEEASEYGSQPR